MSNLWDLRTIDYMNRLANTMHRKDAATLPARVDVLKAYEMTPLESVRVVILGQDPYHTSGKANGLAFGIREDFVGQRLYSSLGNIATEAGWSLDNFGSTVENLSQAHQKLKQWCTLESWAEQGVLLTNTCLTVSAGKPNSHADVCWQDYVRMLLQQVVDVNPNVIWMLWGTKARALYDSLNTLGTPRFILTASHPSKYSATRGNNPFVGCDHFRKTNQYLVWLKEQQIDWAKLPSRFEHKGDRNE